MPGVLQQHRAGQDQPGHDAPGHDDGFMALFPRRMMPKKKFSQQIDE